MTLFMRHVHAFGAGKADDANLNHLNVESTWKEAARDILAG